MPGPFLTDISAAGDADAVAASVAGHALQRVAEPHEIVGSAAVLRVGCVELLYRVDSKIDGGVP